MNIQFDKKRIFLRILMIYIGVLTPIIGFFVYALTYDLAEIEREVDVSRIYSRKYN
jgi:hypothetical protein